MDVDELVCPEATPQRRRRNGRNAPSRSSTEPITHKCRLLSRLSSRDRELHTQLFSPESLKTSAQLNFSGIFIYILKSMTNLSVLKWWKNSNHPFFPQTQWNRVLGVYSVMCICTYLGIEFIVRYISSLQLQEWPLKWFNNSTYLWKWSYY